MSSVGEPLATDIPEALETAMSLKSSIAPMETFLGDSLLRARLGLVDHTFSIGGRATVSLIQLPCYKYIVLTKSSLQISVKLRYRF